MILPVQDYKRTNIKIPGKLHLGIDGFINGFVGNYKRRASVRKDLLAEAVQINEKAESLKDLTNKALKEKLGDYQYFFRRRQKGFLNHYPYALAALVEAAHRTLGLRPYTVQIAGATALYRGNLTEMSTGEGKSLTACLPAILSAWSGEPCHIITVNDYLANRDAKIMSDFYSFCGVTTGSVIGTMPQPERRQNYKKGVVYTTSKELCADFLRDRIVMNQYSNPSRRHIRKLLLSNFDESDGLVLRGLHTAIVDEADSVLIDEAVTPLIISREGENKPFIQVNNTAWEIAKELEKGSDYKIENKYKDVIFTLQGYKKIDLLTKSLTGLWQSSARREEFIKQAVTAIEFYHNDEQYVIKEDKIVIVDEFTGRMMPNRTWRHGLHQSVEAKEGLELSNPSETMARLSFQQFFRFFKNLSGMTGTASEAAGEFWSIYGLPVIKIPTNKPCIREQNPDKVFATSEQKWDSIVDEIKHIHKTKRPILIGTRNIKESETLAERLSGYGLSYNLLNANRHEEEAGIILVAGEEEKITIATNMAGRGTDIKLGSGVKEIGGMHVIATEKHESGRIDRQLFGRCARQGDPGSASAFISLEDELIQRFVPVIVRNRIKQTMNLKIPGSKSITKRMLNTTQRASQRFAYIQRKSVLKMDNWLEESLSYTGSNTF